MQSGMLEGPGEGRERKLPAQGAGPIIAVQGQVWKPGDCSSPGMVGERLCVALARSLRVL